MKRRPRARELGMRIGHFATGPNNAITDVKGVLVGHKTLIRGKGKHKPRQGPVRTGVTAILPRQGNVYQNRVVAGGFVLNGAGEVAGLTQVTEWGLLETPILLTNTHSVGDCAAGLIKHMVRSYPQIGVTADVIIPVVGECDDSWLNDAAGHHVKEAHVAAAIADARSGAVEEGSVGGGTGMITCGFKGGIGTSSRKLSRKDGGYTVGVLVMSNWGLMDDLLIQGVPIGRMLKPDYLGRPMRVANYGSIIAVLATDAPMHTHQLARLSKRAALGIGRMGSYAAHTSGEIVIGFSTANEVPRTSQKREYRMRVVLDQGLDALYEATVEATEEAILNALCAATDMEGQDGHFAPGLPSERVAEILAASNALWDEKRSLP